MLMVTGIRYAPTLQRTFDKLFVPIAPPNYIYSHFKHVSGTLVPEGQRGISINKLKTLNTLIEQANLSKESPNKIILPTESKEENFDLLIEQYADQIRTTWTSASSLPYNLAAPAPTGLLVNLLI
jgi:hypothetical protein